jgi:hypothetical protein
VIAKHVSMKSVKKSGFAELVRYITDAQRKQQRVGTVRVTNCGAEQPQVAVTEILNTQMQNVRATSDKTYHLIVSFRPGEQPDDATLRAIEARLCDALGYGEHQRISAVHRDTDNLHMHVAINKIHPARYTMHDPFNDFWILGKACEQLERDFGLQPDNHQARKTAAENRADDMERHAGVESLLGWIKRECLEKMASAQSWSALHQLMRENGLRLHERGNGLAVSAGDGTAVKASSIGREYSRARLVARFGPFQPAPQTPGDAPPAKAYQARPMRSRIDTSTLYAAYQQAQHHAGAARAQESTAARTRKERQVDAAKRRARLKRAVIRMVGASGPAKKIMYAAVSKMLLAELDRIAAQHRAERRRIGERHRHRTWADWLREGAEQGDGAALAALRARPGNGAPGGDRLTATGARQAAPAHAEQDGVTKQGTVIYRAGAMAVRDDGKALHITGEADKTGLQAALRMALARYGNCISVNGSAAFRENIVAAAAAAALAVKFDDASLELRRKELLRTMLNKEDTNEPFTNGRRRTAAGGIVRGRPAAVARQASPAGPQNDSVCGTPGSAGKPDLGPIGRYPPPESQHRLRSLSELGMVRFTGGSALLLPDHVPGHLEQRGAAANDKLRRPASGAGKITVPGAAEQYIDEMERKRKADRSIRRHLLFSGAQRTLTLAGTRTVAGQGLALLRDGADMLVMPVDDATLQRLEHQPAGARLDVSERGIAKLRGRSR